EAAALAALNVEELKADRDRRLAAEQKKAAEEKAAAAEQTKKTKKIAMIAAPIVVVAIVAAVLISNFVKARQEEAARLDAYNAAVALAEAGQYDEAIAAFTELGDYKDSAEQITETQYAQAVHFVEDGEYGEAISIFDALGDYKDCAEQSTNAAMEQAYQNALRLLDGRHYGEARAAFEALGNYKDAHTYFESFAMRITSRTRIARGTLEVDRYQYDEYGDLVNDGENTYTYSADRKTVTEEGKYSTIIYTYDDQGMLVKSESRWQSTFTYEYNTDGTIAARHESAFYDGGEPFYENIITYEYGSSGCVIKETTVQTFESGSPGSRYTEEFTYDESGQLTASKSDSGTSDFQYTCDWIYAPNADGPYIFPYSGADHP
ncbi:MAG: hypothetical protein HFF87_07860, partial [Oscillibacter sp.]|nr:hypothetical protein [Oscillibacter sp.]